MSNIVLQLEGVTKSYDDGKKKITVLKGVDLSIKAGELVALLGPSGSGKSTLLHIAGLLDTPTKGHVTIGDVKAENAKDAKQTELRRDAIGFVYQHHHLLPEFTALENVMMPLLVQGKCMDVAKKAATKILNDVGLGSRLTHKPSQLSGGEKQRVAIARAMVHTPKLILADEPTGNLDQETEGKVMELLLEQCKKHEAALLMVTHSTELAKHCKKQYHLKGGKV